jgi:hypothetical protein
LETQNKSKSKVRGLEFLKIRKFEFWPYWIFYLPTVPYLLYLMLKARSATFFTNVNPAIYLSGIVGEAKEEILKNIPEQYKAKSILLKKINVTQEALQAIVDKEFRYPLIVKPNIGERGEGVEKVYSFEHLCRVIETYPIDFILQEFIDYEHEFGVMYYRIPNTNEYAVTSIVEKSFLSVQGDGSSSLKELLQQNYRALIVWEYLKERLEDTWSMIPKAGELIYPQPIGNHCKGTTFLNANKYITPAVSNLFNNIVIDYKGFNYGRFDVKVKSVDDLETGKHLRIMELNGVTSEPAHIYDPNMPLRKAYASVLNHFKLVYRISKANTANGYKPAAWASFYNLMKAHYKK